MSPVCDGKGVGAGGSQRPGTLGETPPHHGLTHKEMKVGSVLGEPGSGAAGLAPPTELPRALETLVASPSWLCQESGELSWP